MKYFNEKSNWFNPNIEYLFNSLIYEYDMKDAGFSIIKSYKLLDIDTIKKLNLMDKKSRTIEIGKIMGCNKEFSNSLMNHFSELRKFFIDSNYIEDDDLIAVKKDALFCTKECNQLKFGSIEFRIKNKYSSYLRFPYNNNLEIYYNDGGSIEVKGINDFNLDKHRLYMLDFIYKIFKYIENKNPIIKRFILKFINDYKSLKLDQAYYLEFNNLSQNINPLFNYQKVIIPIIQIIIKEFK